MEPLSIATGCASLLTAVSKLTIQISTFVASVRDARKDMAAVSGELSSLSLCLETSRDDSMRIDYPDGFRENLLTVLKNCDTVTAEMTALLYKLSSANLLRKVQWTAMGRNDMNRLRSSLESQKSALEIGLHMTSLLLISAVKEDVADVKADTAQIPSIKQDTSQIEGLVQQIGLLRLQLDNGLVNDARVLHIQMFLDQSTTYAETVIDAIEDEASFVQPLEESVPDSPKDGQQKPPLNFKLIDANDKGRQLMDIRKPTPEEPTDQRDTDLNPIEGELSRCEPLSNSMSKLSENGPHTLDEDGSSFGNRGDGAAQTSSHLPDTSAAPHHTTTKTAMESSSATAEADENLIQRPHSTVAMVVVSDSSSKRSMLSTRDQKLIQQARVLRDVLGIKERKKVDEALETSIRGKRSLTGRLRPRTAWSSRETGSYDEIEILLDRGADPDHSSFGANLCTIEMSNAGRLNVVALLLSRGASFELSTAGAWLGKAAKLGKSNLVKDLLDSGVSPNNDYKSCSALANATAMGHAGIVRLLLDRGAIAVDDALKEATSAKHDDIVEWLLEHQNSSISEDGKRVAASIALRKRNFEILKLLLEHDAPANDPVLMRVSAGAGRADVVKLLLDQGASANVRHGMPNPLHQAVWNGHLGVVKLLLEHGAIVSTATLDQYGGYARVKGTQVERNEIRVVLRRHFDQQKRARSTKSP